MSLLPKDTRAEDVSIEEVLGKKHYTVDYYQREYMWGDRQVDDLMSDLSMKFNESYTPGDENDYSSVKKYKQYFLGSFILSKKPNFDYIIDGQQRLTTLTLIYLYIYRRSQGENSSIEKKSLEFIYSDEYGKDSFNISVEDRAHSMKLLLDGKTQGREEEDALFRNYLRIERYLDSMLDSNEKMELFFYWLSSRVSMVRIVAYDDSEAYVIFESMNDRGKPLSNIDMLKGYMLSLVEGDEREKATATWKSIEKELGNDFDDFIISLFRAKWARSTQKTSDASKNNDWTEIGNHFHRWLKENKDREGVGLSDSKSVEVFIDQMVYYSGLYRKIQEYKTVIEEGYEDLAYIYYQGITNTELLFLALIEYKDPSEDLKIKAISKFLSIRLALHNWIGHDTTGTNFNDYVVRLLKRLRSIDEHEDIQVLVWFFYEELRQRPSADWFNPDNSPQLTKGTKERRRIFGILSVLTARLEVENGRSNPFVGYHTIKHDVEHVLASDLASNSEDFNSQEELDSVRNSIGALGILEKKVNSSLSDQSYREKREKYLEHNSLLGTLSDSIYKSQGNGSSFRNKPGLNRFLQKNPSLKGLFKGYSKFTGSEIIERNKLYSELCKIVWDKEDLLLYCRDEFDNFEQLDGFVEKSYPKDHEPVMEEVSRSDGRLYSKGTILMSSFTKHRKKVEIRGEIMDNNMFSITYIRNAPIKEKFTNAGKKSFGQKYSFIYNEITKFADIKNGFYSWGGKSSPVTIETAMELVSGGKTQNTPEWEVQGKPSGEPASLS